MSERLQSKTTNHKIPDENIGGKILYVDLSNICLHLTQKVITSKIKINKWDYQTKKICTEKKTMYKN